MKCINCREEYDEELFEICPYCLTPRQESVKDVEENKSNNSYDNDMNEEEQNSTEELVEEEVAQVNCEFENNEVEQNDVQVKCSENSVVKHDIDEHKLLGNIHKSLELGSVAILMLFGFTHPTIVKLNNQKIVTLNDLNGLSKGRLESILGSNATEKILLLKNKFQISATDLLDDVLVEQSSSTSFQKVLMRAQGATLQEVADQFNVSREDIRQKESKLLKKITPLVKVVINEIVKGKKYITRQEVEDIYDNDDHDKILVAWMKKGGFYEYLDFAELFISSEKTKKFHELRIWNSISNIIGNGINLYDNLECIDETLRKLDYEFLDLNDILSLLKKYGCYFYGDYVYLTKQSYGLLCAKIVKTEFPQGIKLPGEDLQKLRKFATQYYGDIELPDKDRALIARVTNFLVLRDRGVYIAEENIMIEMDLLETIKDYIDESEDGIIYYSELYSNFSGMLGILSSIDNYNYLHGVLKLYYPDRYIYTRDFLQKEGTNLKEEHWNDKLESYMASKNEPVAKNEIKKELPGITDIVLTTATTASEKIFMWDYNTYYSLEKLQYTSDDIGYLKRTIESIMEKYKGYCNDRLLFEQVNCDRKDFLNKNNIILPKTLYYFCLKVMSDIFDFRNPHIINKDLKVGHTMKDIVLYLLDDPKMLLYSDFAKLTADLKWSKVTASFVFNDLLNSYMRISGDEYLKHDDIVIDEADIQQIENAIEKEIKYGFFAFSTFDQWETLPDLGYEWNPYLLDSIIDLYSLKYRIITPESKDRRYEKGVAVKKESHMKEYVDVVINMLTEMGISRISEKDLMSLMIINNLISNRIIPREIYMSKKLKYKDEIFSL